MSSPLNGYGSYLIRGSESNQGGYALSIRDKDQVKHYKINLSENGEFFVTARSTFKTARSSFKTLQDLVTHYQQQADGLCVNLKKPCVIAPTDVSGQVIDILGKSIDKWQTDRGSIIFVTKRMSDGLSEVWEGIWNDTTPVAVKINKSMTEEDFLQSANLLKKLQHPNLVQLYAICSMEEPVYIITELMKHGSLLNYLCGEEKSLKFHQLIHMASQVASGMAYLEEQNIIHRDLTARNVLVDEGVLCKVTNFELARVMDRDFYEGQEEEQIDIKWAAPEVLLHRRFSIKSDVWSFGIVLYEIITYGKSPYPGMNNDKVKHQVQKGYRIPQPVGCPDKLYYENMVKCWQMELINRPTFETLQQQLANFLIVTPSF